MKSHCDRHGRVLVSKAIPEDLHQKESLRRAAILIPLCNRNGKASVLFNIRSKIVSTHKGQVSFPGGHINAGETEIEAAIRETYEEYGSSIGRLEVVGTCQTVPAVTGTLVTPVIAYLHGDVKDFESFEPSADEVARIFSRPLTQLNDKDYKCYEILSRGNQSVRMPAYGPPGEERIWGLTAFVLEAVMKRVIVPTASFSCN